MKPRVLIIDDELGPRESLRFILKSDYEIRTAPDGRAGLQEVETYRPAVVLLDLKMPEFDGLEVLRRIKYLDSAIQVVIITAYASADIFQLADHWGAFACLTKPFPTQDLLDVVRRAVAHSQARARLGREVR